MRNTLSTFYFVLCALFAAAQPSITTSSLIQFEEGNNAWKATVANLATIIGTGGTVTSFSSGNLSPLFTTSVANATSTPSQTFTLSNAGANTWFGNNTGSSAAPAYVSAGALTKSDDTNVTLTLGGSPTTALLNAASLTLGWTGTLAVARGGIGVGTITGLMQGNGTGAVTGISNSSTVGQILRVTGASTYAWGALDLADGDAVTGQLGISNGGTGLNAVGSDFTFLGSNGTANFYGTPAFTHNDAAFSVSRSSSTVNFNVPNATASLGGIVSTTTQTFAGAKTYTGAVTVQGLTTGSAGVVGTATSSVAALNSAGVSDADFAVITSNTTLDHTHNFINIGTLSADITISLPACNSTRDGWEYTFLKTGTDAFAFILDPNSTETFYDSATTKSVYSQGSTAYCKCRSSNNTWFYSR